MEFSLIKGQKSFFGVTMTDFEPVDQIGSVMCCQDRDIYISITITGLDQAIPSGTPFFASGDKTSTSFTWTIEDFLNRPESQKEFMYSSPFTVFGPNDKETTWRLKLYPREDEVTVYLENTGKTTKERVFHELSIVNGGNLF